MPDAANLTERQEKWFESVRKGLELETGRSLAEWAELARACPETAHRKRLAWMKAQFGLGQNRAAIVLNAALPPDTGWSKPQALADALWIDPAARAIHAALSAAVTALPDVRVGQRKGFTAYSRNFQFCAARPVKQHVLLGLAIRPETDPALLPAAREAWSERLLSKTVLASPNAVTAKLTALLRASWETS